MQPKNKLSAKPFLYRWPFKRHSMLYIQACKITLTLNIEFSALAPNPHSVVL